MTSGKKLIKEAIREFILEDKKKDVDVDVEDLDDFQYATIARSLIMKYEDGTVDQNISRLVDDYVASHKATTGKSLDGEKLYDAVVDEMQTFVDSTNVRSFGGT